MRHEVNECVIPRYLLNFPNYDCVKAAKSKYYVPTTEENKTKMGPLRKTQGSDDACWTELGDVAHQHYMGATALLERAHCFNSKIKVDA